MIETILCDDVDPDLDFSGHFCLTDILLEWETEEEAEDWGDYCLLDRLNQI